MKPLVATVIFSLVTTVSSSVYNRSLIFPLFTPPGGKPFDDGTYAIVPPVIGIQSLLINHGDYIDGIQATYTLQDGQSIKAAYHGGKGGNSTFVKFGLTESVVRVEGYSKLVPPKSYMTMLIFYTRDSSGHIHQYGPVGSGIPAYLSLFNFAGVVIGLYGESGQYLNGLGFEYDTSESPNVLPFYKKTPLTGGRGGTPFDDALSTLNPLQIKHMTIHFGQYINGISTTYLLRNGSLIVKEHGTLDLCPENNIGTLNTQVVYIDFADDERITLIVVAHSYEPKNRVNFLKFFTWGSKGVLNEYGPYGSGQDVPGNNSATFEGVVNGFYGRSGKVIDALGFYI